MADYAKWYRSAHGSGLFAQFQDSVGTVQKSQGSNDLIGPKTSQSILTTRAHLSVSEHGAGLIMQDPGEFVLTVMNALSTGTYGVLVGLTGTFAGRDANHAILAIGYTDNQIAVYDPNYPGKFKAIDYDLATFALNYDKDFVPKGSPVVSTERSVESADTRTTTSLSYSANLAFVTYDMGKQVNLANFDFANCTYASQNGTIVTAMSVDGVPFIEANNVPITVEFHSKTYQKDSGAEELVSFSDASGSLTCQRAMVHIAVEPGSTKDNYRYRVHIAPGGYCIPSTVQTTGKYKSGEDWNDSSPEDFTIGEDRVLSLDAVNDTGSVVAATIQPEAIEAWAADPTSTVSWSVGGDANCDDGSSITTEHALATITLIP